MCASPGKRPPPEGCVSRSPWLLSSSPPLPSSSSPESVNPEMSLTVSRLSVPSDSSHEGRPLGRLDARRSGGAGNATASTPGEGALGDPPTFRKPRLIESRPALSESLLTDCTSGAGGGRATSGSGLVPRGVAPNLSRGAPTSTSTFSCGASTAYMSSVCSTTEVEGPSLKRAMSRV